jgi:glycerophosphoryl diester phosphodiesterase
VRVMKPLLCIAHRGGPLVNNHPLPENSLAAIARALTLGVDGRKVDGIEIDVYQVHGELFITHDRRLGKVSSGAGIITEQSLEYLHAQRLTNGEPIPQLIDVLQLIGNKTSLNIEIKGPNTIKAVSDCLQNYVTAMQYDFAQYIISSFDHQQLFDSMTLLPQVKRGVLIEGIPLDYAACCEPLKAYSFNTHLSFLSQELIQDAKKRGLKNWVYTVNNEEDWQYVKNLGVDAVFTDVPDKLIAFNCKGVLS